MDWNPPYSNAVSDLSENANRLLQTRNLNAEIDELHLELLEERAAKAVFARELKRAKEELARLRNAVSTTRTYEVEKRSS